MHSSEERAISTELQSVVYGILGISSMIFNCLIILVICLHKKMRSSGNYLLINLALSDLLIVMVGIPATIYNLSTTKITATYRFSCSITGYMLLVGFLVSNFNLTLIAIHRYILISMNNFYTKNITNKRIVLVIICSWLLAIILSTLPLIGWGKFHFHFRRAHCMIDWGFDRSYLIFLQVIAYPIPLAVLIFCYYKILKKTASSKKRLSISVDKHNLKKRLSEQRLTVMLLVVVITFFICFLPYAIIIYAEGIFLVELSEVFSFIAMICAYCNSMADFWIYSVMSKKFRAILKYNLRQLLRTNNKISPVPLPQVLQTSTEDPKSPQVSQRRASYIHRMHPDSTNSVNNFYSDDMEKIRSLFVVVIATEKRTRYHSKKTKKPKEEF